MLALPSYSKALDVALSVVPHVSATEKVTLDVANNRFLAANIVADRDFPPYNRSQMDGYAVVASEIEEGVSMQVLNHVSAGTTFAGEHQPNTCVAIATGAPVPSCFDSVVQHELTDSGNEIVTFHCTDIRKGKAIHLQGVDAKVGDVLVNKFTKMSPQHIGIAASVGQQEIEVVAMPRVIVITSGDEVVAPNEQPLPHQIRNGNNPMISSAFRSMGCQVVESHHVPDDPERTNDLVAQVLDGRCDLVVTIGGISAGKRDFFPDAFDKAGVDIVIKGVKIQPGKPVIVGKHSGASVLGLPGNPVSALACSCIFGWPIVRALQGMPVDLPWQKAPLASAVKPNPQRRAFRPCSLVDGVVRVPQWQGSGDLVHTATTHGLVQLPPSEIELHEGDIVSCLAFPWL
jgi:molybdopterin molybdotransferase